MKLTVGWPSQGSWCQGGLSKNHAAGLMPRESRTFNPSSAWTAEFTSDFLGFKFRPWPNSCFCKSIIVCVDILLTVRANLVFNSSLGKTSFKVGCWSSIWAGCRPVNVPGWAMSFSGSESVCRKVYAEFLIDLILASEVFWSSLENDTPSLNLTTNDTGPSRDN